MTNESITTTKDTATAKINSSKKKSDGGKKSKKISQTESLCINATKALKSGLENNSKMHKVSSSIIGAMRLNYGGNWFCNIRSRAD